MEQENFFLLLWRMSRPTVLRQFTPFLGPSRHMIGTVTQCYGNPEQLDGANIDNLITNL